MVAGRCVTQGTNAKEERWSKEEESVARLQEAGDSVNTRQSLVGVSELANAKTGLYKTPGLNPSWKIVNRWTAAGRKKKRLFSEAGSRKEEPSRKTQDQVSAFFSQKMQAPTNASTSRKTHDLIQPSSSRNMRDTKRRHQTGREEVESSGQANQQPSSRGPEEPYSVAGSQDELKEDPCTCHVPGGMWLTKVRLVLWDRPY
ncbi:hypothetical protein NDU88_006004 [Pleurodeles waltl]|uniref:Uncharacterized protein n=1 Tax=Pleurodeles waltl TaxID=8319 RepID=A0AAV7RQQ9_PLEWA|nr:hypothetical protein NDU88_006004 [Pleurodeles waltl]